MAISQKVINEIIKEKTHFEAGVDIHTGDVVWLNGNWVQENDSGEIIELTDAPYKNFDEILMVRYNDKVDKRIRNYLPVVLNQRGVTSPQNIDSSHPHVRKKINELRNAKGRNKRTVTQEETNNIIQMIRNSHEPQYMAALLQIILWAIVYEDVFKLQKASGGTSLETKFDNVEIKDEYWDLQIEKDEDDELLSGLIGNVWRVDFLKFDKNNPLEVMLAYVTQLLETFPEIVDNITVFQTNVFVAFTYGSGGVDYDEAGFLYDELHTTLRKPRLRLHTIEQREKPSGRIRNSDEKVAASGFELEGQEQS